MAKILMVGSEASPFAKTGGLADVLGSLPRALHTQGEDVAVLIPRFRSVKSRDAQRIYDELPLWLGPRVFRSSVYQIIEGGVPYYFLDCPELYDRPALYGDGTGDYEDNHIRFAVLAQGALAVVRHVFRPQVLHCHDWQAGLVPAYIKTLFSGDPTFTGIRTLFTVHNLGYQGIFSPDVLPMVRLPWSAFHPEGVEFYGRISYLKAGLWFSEALSTVSPTYAKEIQTLEFGFGMDGLLRARSDHLTGILNGADYTQWNPETDAFLIANYSERNLEGKKKCKADLLAGVGLPADAIDKPLVGIISRFAGQKGFDLLAGIAEAIADLDLCLVALGTGEPQYEAIFRQLAEAHPQKVAVKIAFDERLAHKIEAGSDMFLMPSHYEPCGLNQIYSLRYGTVPVVRATGGLDDTIDEKTGFKFREYSDQALLGAIREALEAYGNPMAWKAMMVEGMKRDYSWEASAREYSELYRRLID